MRGRGCAFKRVISAFKEDDGWKAVFTSMQTGFTAKTGVKSRCAVSCDPDQRDGASAIMLTANIGDVRQECAACDSSEKHIPEADPVEPLPAYHDIC